MKLYKRYIILNKRRRNKRTNHRPFIFKITAIVNLMGINNWTKKIFYSLEPGMYHPYKKIDINTLDYHNLSVYGDWNIDEYSKLVALKEIVPFGHGVRFFNHNIGLV